MFKILVDTCVWLDVAKDQRQVPVISVIEEMVKQKVGGASCAHHRS